MDDWLIWPIAFTVIAAAGVALIRPAVGRLSPPALLPTPSPTRRSPLA